MPIWMPSDTQKVLLPEAKKCDSRSLFMDRFADPAVKDTGDQTPRRDWFNRLTKMQPALKSRALWGGKLTESQTFHAQLQSRLMVNMAGGVMENAGLCLDRFGLPYIPGSAVKGCARRMAIQELLEAEPRAKADLLIKIALVFGWSEQDWGWVKKEGRFHSDFAYAVGEGQWAIISTEVRKCLPNADHFAGAVSFLPAQPVDAAGAELPLRPPALGTLELDVVTCHQAKYYRGERDVATDDDEPNPVIFPAVAAGHVFAFMVLPLRNCTDALLANARGWLAGGLTAFGLGAKTAAGYGWFDCSEHIQAAVNRVLQKREEQEAKRRQAEAEAAAQKSKEEANRIRREQFKAAMDILTPDQQEDFKVAQLTEDQFRSALDNFSKKTPEENRALVRALRLASDAPNSRRAFWDELKSKAQKKGGKPAQIENLIRQLSKQMYPGKEGKMP